MSNIIGDIAGNYNTLMALIKQMPEGEVISVGDMIDRGPRSKQVLEWFMNNGVALLGNHEQMFIGALAGDPCEAFNSLANGGLHTVHSFCPEADIKRLDDWITEYSDYLRGKIEEEPLDGFKYFLECMTHVPSELVVWMKSLPVYTERDSAFISHAPKSPNLTIEKASDLSRKDSLTWNRGRPRRLKDKLQIFGHNSVPLQSGPTVATFQDKEGIYAYCIDTSRADILTGIHWPSQKIYQQPYID